MRKTQWLLFARNFVKHPKMLGSVVPSSPFLVKEVLDRIDWNRARVIVEYGPGVGTFTGEMLRRMRPDARLIALETNPDFVHFLRGEFSDARLIVVNRSAGEIRSALREHSLDRADYIVSGIPFSTMDKKERDAVLRESHAALAPDGAFLVYQFSSRVLPDLKRIFGSVERGFAPLNILPAQLFFCAA